MGTSPRIASPLAVLVLVGAIVQVLAPVIPFAGIGASPNESTVDLLITPAGYTFSIWSVIYLLSIALAVAMLAKTSTGTPNGERVARDLAIAFFGAAVWILLSAAEWEWATSVVLTVMTLALLDAARIVARSADVAERSWLTALTRTTVGIYAGWATAAVFQNWASDIAAAGADPSAPVWQVVVLVLAAMTAVAVTWWVGGVLIGYPLTIVWALIGIIVTASEQTTTVVVVAAVTIGVVFGAAVLSMRRARLSAGPSRSTSAGPS